MKRFNGLKKSEIYVSPRSDDPRIGNFIKAIPETELEKINRGYVLIGYPEDEGIKRNLGRTGSCRAPKEIRKSLFKLAPGKLPYPPIHDLGDIEIPKKLKKDLRTHQTFSKTTLSQVYQKGLLPITLGGGHDFAYPDVSAFLNEYSNQNPVVINIDAHLDVRPTVSGPHSGTPFFQILEEFNRKIELIEIGIQKSSNSLDHIKYLKSKNAKIFFLQDCISNLDKIFTRISKKRRPAFLSVDIDGFSANFAPGCSAPSPIGLDANEFLKGLPILIRNLDIKGLGIYEVSPKFDLDNRTSKLAALIIQNFIYYGKI